MNEELTNEVLEAMKRCNETQGQRLATALLEERAKPKVWDGAPEWAVRGIVNWFDENGVFIDSNTYTRELPKTRARQIAEEISDELNKAPRYKTEIEIIESALNKYAKGERKE